MNHTIYDFSSPALLLTLILLCQEHFFFLQKALGKQPVSQYNAAKLTTENKFLKEATPQAQRAIGKVR